MAAQVKAQNAPAQYGLLARKKTKWKPIHWLCLAFALVPLIAFVIFSGFPVGISFMSMFVDMKDNVLQSMIWNNFDNFVQVFKDERFWYAWRTTLWLATAQVVTLTIALVISVLLNSGIKGAKVLQVIYFIPYICSSVSVAIMWGFIFDVDRGALNAILGQTINWLGQNNDVSKPELAVWAVYITVMWQAPSYGIVMFKAALTNINPSLYEAASLDGANGWNKFWNVTMPGIKSVFLFLLLAGINSGLGVFDAVKVLFPPNWTGIVGPADYCLTINYYIYIKGVAELEMEYAAVMSWVLFAVNFGISFFIIRARNKASEE